MNIIEYPSLSLDVSQHCILDLKECTEVRGRVLALRDRWTQRGGGGFYTLGASAYLDAPASKERYAASAIETNSFMGEVFSDLYETIRVFFEGLLKEPAHFHPRFALPGFHIFVLTGSGEPESNVAARAHFDLQFASAMPESDFEGTLSFTLSIDEPTEGSSLAVWPVRYNQIVKLGISARECAEAHADFRDIPYRRGQIVVHDGLILHAIGRAKERSKGLRITFQGHGVRQAGEWILYW